MPEALTFNAVAQNILRDSISSAIFIDDKALGSFKSKNYSPEFIVDHNRTLELYEDFKNKNCLLHSFKFTKSGWKNNKEFYLKNKDLLILDWQLVREEHTEALKILDEAVKRKSLHFTCIYTQEATENVKRELNRYFWGNVVLEIKEEHRELFSETDLDGFWDINKNESDWRELESLLDNIINANKQNVQGEIQTFINHFNIDQVLAERILELESNNPNASYEKLKTILRQDDDALIYSSLEESRFYSHSAENDITLYINHTIIKIFRKPDVNGNVLYETFLESFLGSEQNVFFSLMGLEMRNRFKENSAFVGKDFDDISEEAFFFHKEKNIANKFIFIDFLRDILKDQVASFLYERKLDLFDVLDEYYAQNEGAAKQASFNDPQNIDAFYKETYKLNYFYNRLNTNERSKNDFLRFGDIFISEENIKDATGEITGIKKRYFLCLTPHCDCLKPSKMDNQFWFIEGKLAETSNGSKKKILDGTDGKYLSFIKIDNNIEVLYWENSSIECKPKTFYVENNKFDNNNLSVLFNNHKMVFNLIGSLKENYAQRLANRAFGYPLRVGIDFVKKK
jgi:hypothetical protein